MVVALLAFFAVCAVLLACLAALIWLEVKWEDEHFPNRRYRGWPFR